MTYERCRLHVEPPDGWLNDPNGFCFFGGRYHLYFQYSPGSPDGTARKCWGHYESRDLVNWEFTGVPLVPDIPEDADGVYSGSAVVSGGKMHIFYTGNVKHPGDHDYIHSGRESNTICVTSNDSRRMSAKKVLLRPSDYPDFCTCHVRDPKVNIGSDGVWRMVLGARAKDERGLVLLDESADGGVWQYAGYRTTEKPFGYMWECPDMFELAGRRLLLVCPQGLSEAETGLAGPDAAGCFISGGGTGLNPENFIALDRGFDFYAPQSFVSPDGRRMIIGWMGPAPEGASNPTVSDGRQGCLTLPCELKFNSRGQLVRIPAAEIEKVFGETAGIGDGETVAAPVPFRLRAGSQHSFRIILSEGPDIVYDSESGVVTMTFAGKDCGAGRTKRQAPAGAKAEIELIADNTALELFVNGGETVMSTRYYPSGRGMSVSPVCTDAEISYINE